jgi:HCOMODA/2-hydroxy-3-carboxy-muconic semialdehyde decarboxylase
MMINTMTPATEVVDAAHTLAHLGLVDAYGHVSVRLSQRSALITPARDLSTVAESDLVELSVDEDTLPALAPAESHLHLAIYRARSDVDAICRAQPTAGLAVSALTDELHPVHGQAAWLGTSVPVHPQPLLLRSAALGHAAALTLGAQDALLLRGNGAVTTAETPGVAAARMWILATTCDIWLRTSAIAPPRPLHGDEISEWRATRNELLPRLWEHLRKRAADAASSNNSARHAGANDS